MLRHFLRSSKFAGFVAVCCKSISLIRVAHMIRFPLITAFFIGLAVFLPQEISAQFKLFKAAPHASVYRAAKRYNLAAVEKVDPSIYIDLRYAVTSATGKPIYPSDMPCLLHKSTAEKLKKVNAELKPLGYALMIWDAWRPPEAHLALWNAVQDPRFVVPPSKGLSWHCYGVSVDVTLVNLDGTPVKMPTPFDEFSDRAASNHQGADLQVAKRLTLLQTSMKKVGFRTIKSEWWHFDDMKVSGRVRKVSAEDLGIRLP